MQVSLSRAWFSPPGAGLYVSIVCRNESAAPLSPLRVALRWPRNRAATDGRFRSWPNDVVVEDSSPLWWRKLAGILAEASTSADGLQYVILGFGINLRPAAYPPELSDRATSIEAELGRTADGAAVLAETLTAFDRWFLQLSRGDSSGLLARWRELAPSSRGAVLEWDTPHGVVQGISAGLADDGALLVRVHDRIERIISGELRWK